MEYTIEEAWYNISVERCQKYISDKVLNGKAKKTKKNNTIFPY